MNEPNSARVIPHDAPGEPTQSIWQVVLHGKDGKPVAWAYVEAPDAAAAHTKGLRLIRAQSPEIEAQNYDQTLVMSMLYRSGMD